jgi:PilZ domain-containing protein
MPTTRPRSRRLGLALPLVVSGRDLQGRAFEEEAETRNISAGGLCFETARRLPIGARLRLDVRLTASLRPRFGGRARYAVRAVVCRIENFAGADRYRVGVRFLGEA